VCFFLFLTELQICFFFLSCRTVAINSVNISWTYDGVCCWTAQSKLRKSEFEKTQNPVETCMCF
jgi:hypothetical protein